MLILKVHFIAMTAYTLSCTLSRKKGPRHYRS